MKKIRFLIALMACSPLVAQSPSMKELQMKFDLLKLATKAQDARVEQNFHEGDSYWFIYGAEGELLAFQATGQLSYLEAFLRHWYAFQDNALPSNSFPNPNLPAYTTEEALGKQNYYKDTYLSWDNHGKREYDQGQTNGGEYPLFETHGFQCVPKMLYVLYLHPALRQTKNARGGTYQDDFDKILPWFEKNIWDKWFDRGTKNLFRSQTHITSHAANMALYLSKIHPKKLEYKYFLDDFNSDADGHGYSSYPSSFRGQLRKHTYSDTGTAYEGYIWNPNWGKMTGATDTNHNQAEFRHIANQMMFAGGYWNDADKARFLATAHWQLENSEGPANYKMDLSPNKKDGQWAGMVYYGVAAWGRFDEDLQTALSTSKLYRNTKPALSARKKILVGNMMYNRAFLDGTMAYPDY
jgi:hypothetical protein